MDDKSSHPGHEQTDVSVGAISKFTIGLTIATIATLGLMWIVFNLYAGREAARSPQPAPMTQVDPMKEPPEPRLQTRPVADLKQIRADEEALLHRYEWVDPDKGIVRIPIQRAMELIAKEGSK